jgi:3-dehydroquinate dehydratase II
VRVLLLNGPNLDLLGTRRPDVYGTTTLADLESRFRGWAAALGMADVEAFQSNHEGDLIERLHAARGTADGVVFNPGALTHSSYALHDAIEAAEVPTVEVHISDVDVREPWRRISVVRPACAFTISGRGVDGYRWALQHLVARTAHPPEDLRAGDGPWQRADLRLPAGAPPPGGWPLAALVHGGFWRHRWLSDTTDLVAVDLARRGVASLNVEYRRVGPPENPQAGGGGGGEVSLGDVVAAISAGLAHPAVDAGRWAVAGHSAGGQLALAAVDRLRTAGAAPPRLAASLAGLVALRDAVAAGLGGGAAAAYVGGDDVVRLDPSALVPLGAPLLVAHGRADGDVPLAQSEAFAAAALAAGDHVELLIHDGDHYGYLEPADPAWTAVAARLITALRSEG